MTFQDGAASYPIEDDEMKFRVLEMGVALADILPIYGKDQRLFLRGAFQVDIADAMPAFFLDLARAAFRHPERAAPYVRWLREACDYILGQRDSYPAMDITHAQTMEEIVRRQIRTMSKDVKDKYAARPKGMIDNG